MKTGSLAPCQVLLVDDDEDVRHEYKKVLERLGVDVITAKDGVSALDALGTHRPDVIVTDLNMPVMDGLEFMRSVREFDLDVPVVVATGNSNLEDAFTAMDYGAFQFLTKPINPDQLEVAIAQASQLHTLTRLHREAAHIDGHPSARLPDRAALEGRFRKAMEKLWVAFQPIVHWSTRSTFAFEALVRSDEPSMSMPNKLFEAAQLLDRTNELGQRIRQKIAKAARKADPAALIFVNLTPSDLNDDELFSELSSLAPLSSRVVYEITERSELSMVSDLSAKLKQLRVGGARIAIDDLGAGYSSLSSFVHLEPDFVKLDMSLVRDVHLSPPKLSLVRGLTRICRGDLDIQVICEGVETREELETLTNEGLDLLQGYYFAKPGPPFPEARFDGGGD